MWFDAPPTVLLAASPCAEQMATLIASWPVASTSQVRSLATPATGAGSEVWRLRLREWIPKSGDSGYENGFRSLATPATGVDSEVWRLRLRERFDQLLAQFADELRIGIGVFLLSSADQRAQPFKISLFDLLDDFGVLRQQLAT